jgi:hypothetical protein
VARSTPELKAAFQRGLPLTNPQLLHVGSEARLALKEWAEEEGVSVNAILVSVLEEFFKRLKKSKALREELRLEEFGHGVASCRAISSSISRARATALGNPRPYGRTPPHGRFRRPNSEPLLRALG